MKMKTIASILSALVISISLIAGEGPTGEARPEQTTDLSGMVVDKSSGEALGGVEITIEGTDQHYYTDFDGKFEISNLEPGTYSFIITYISYEKSLIENVELNLGSSNDLDIRLMSAK